MKNTSVIFVFLCITSFSYSQFYFSDFYRNHNEKTEKRNKWLFEERLYPYVSPGAPEKSLKQRQLLRNRGFSDNSSSWISLGPSPGTYNFVPAASRVRVIAYDPDSTNTIYIGASNGGVWKSTDGGSTWQAKTDFEASLSSGALAVYNNWSTNPPQRIVYYGTGEGGFGFVYSFYGRGLLKSTDGGDTWRQITNGLPPTTYFYRIAINPASPNVLLAALGSGYANPVNTGGLYRSEDYGESWQRIVPSSIGEEGLNCTDVIFSPDGQKAYILGPFITGSPNWWENGCGYRISNDGGRTFTQISTNLPGTGYFALYPPNPNIMYALTVKDCNESQLFRSIDGGLTWIWINSSFSSNQCGYNMAVEMHPTMVDNVYVGTLSYYRSNDRGNNFEISEVFHYDIHDIAFNPKNPIEMMVATDGGIVKSNDNGLTFTYLNNTLTTLECYSVGTDPSDETHLLAGTQDNGIQQKSPFTPGWNGVSAYDATNVIIDENNPDIYIAQLSASPQGIFVSTNRGMFWDAGMGFPRTYDYVWVRPIIKLPGAGNYLTPSGSQVYSSTNYGFIWERINNNDISDKIQELAADPNNSNVLYAATGEFEYMPEASQHNIYKSADGGQTWVNLTAASRTGPAALPNRYISSIQVDKNNSNDVFVTYAGFGTNHLYHSPDGGQTWTIMDCNGDDPCFPDAPVNDLVIRYHPETGVRELYAATDVGVFVNRGESLWHELSGGLPNCIVMDLEITGSKLRAATFGRGIFEWDLGSSNKPLKPSQKNTVLNITNYPNPFNPFTEISFTLSLQSFVKLSVYDILGREILMLVNQKLDASRHSFKWDGSQFSSGVYFYRLQVDGLAVTRKMLLVK